MSFIPFSSAEDPARHNIGCDPEDYPTAAYIERYKEAYNNPNIVRIGFDVRGNRETADDLRYRRHGSKPAAALHSLKID